MMKKYALFLAVSLTLSGNANAVTHQEFEEHLDTLQRQHPIVKELRDDWRFKMSATAHLKKNPNAPAHKIVFDSFNDHLAFYIERMGENSHCWNLVERSGSLYIALKEHILNNSN